MVSSVPSVSLKLESASAEPNDATAAASVPVACISSRMPYVGAVVDTVGLDPIAAARDVNVPAEVV